MAQLIYFAIGVFALAKGQLDITKNRRLPPGRARAFGALFVLAALLGFTAPSMFSDPIAMTLSYVGFGVVLTGLAFVFSVPK